MSRAWALVLGMAMLGSTGCGGETRDPKSPIVASAETTSARADANKALVKRFLDEAWGKRDLDAIPSLARRAGVA